MTTWEPPTTDEMEAIARREAMRRMTLSMQEAAETMAQFNKTVLAASESFAKMAEAMNREPDPATDEGYGPRAVND